MRNFQRLGQLGLMMAGAAIAIVAYEAGRARAGVPTKQPLVYTGSLTDESGTPDVGERTIAVDLYSSEAPSDKTPLCPTSSHTFKLVETGGRFSIALNDECATAVQGGGNEPWVEVRIDGKPMSRSKIAAVPYALEANTANSARALVSEATKGLTEKIGAEFANPECPAGYARKEDLVPWTGSGQSLPEFVYCVSENGTGNDEVVRVGTGRSAFWIDRYEASIWPTPAGYAGDLNAQKFRYPSMDDTYTSNFPKNGQVKRGNELYAVSGRGVTGSCNVSWFQAAEACAASGKRLPTGAEWLQAARGTHDPAVGNNGFANKQCNTLPPSAQPREAGQAIGDSADASCISDWGAEDMIGNFGEWTADWHAGVGAIVVPFDKPAWGELDGYGGDKSYNILSKVEAQPNGAPAKSIDGLPAAIVRGGNWTEGEAGGLFTFTANVGPTFWHFSLGFRCMIPR